MEASADNCGNFQDSSEGKLEKTVTQNKSLPKNSSG